MMKFSMIGVIAVASLFQLWHTEVLCGAALPPGRSRALLLNLQTRNFIQELAYTSSAEHEKFAELKVLKDGMVTIRRTDPVMKFLTPASEKEALDEFQLFKIFVDSNNDGAPPLRYFVYKFQFSHFSQAEDPALQERVIGIFVGPTRAEFQPMAEAFEKIGIDEFYYVKTTNDLSYLKIRNWSSS